MKMIKIPKSSLLIFVLLIFNNIYSQTPCVGGFAGIYPCNDYDLMSHISLEELTNAINADGNDAWGWTDPMNNNEYAIIATSHSTAFVNITDPVNPIFLGRVETETSTSIWRDVKVYNNHAFIVADNVGAHGMQVFDLTRLRNVASPPETFTPDAVYTGVNSCHNIVINEDEGIAYLVGCNTYSGGPTFVNISNPLLPTDAGGYSEEGYSHDAQVVTYSGPDSDYTGHRILIASNGYSDKLVILDVTDKENTVKISEVSYSQTAYTHQGWFTEDMTYFIVGDELDEVNYGLNTRTLVFDFSDLDNPTLSSTYYGPTSAIDHNGYVLGDTYFLSNYRAGMRVLDISNISSPSNPMTEIGYFDTFPDNDSTAFNGAWSVYPYFASGNIVISDIDRGLFVVRKSNTLNTNSFNITKSFVITPNPASNNTKIIAKENQSIKSISIINTLGQSIFVIDNINQNEFVLQTQNYPKGVYYIKINNLITKRLLLN